MAKLPASGKGGISPKKLKYRLSGSQHFVANYVHFKLIVLGRQMTITRQSGHSVPTPYTSCNFSQAIRALYMYMFCSLSTQSTGTQILRAVSSTPFHFFTSYRCYVMTIFFGPAALLVQLQLIQKNKEIRQQLRFLTRDVQQNECTHGVGVTISRP